MICEAALALIKRWEGLKLEAYRDQVGKLTIGWGHTLNVLENDTCSEQEAEDWLIEDLEYFERVVSRLVQVMLNENQKGALVSFVFNLGLAHVKDGTIWKLLNRGLYEEAADQFPRWVKENGEPSQGLLHRREAERALFLS